MAYKPVLTVDVEFEGATFTFRSPDLSWGKISAMVTQLVGKGVSAAELDSNPPVELLQILVELFVEGVVAWDGVMGEKAPLACNTPNKRAIPFVDKIEIAKLYVTRCNELQEKKVPSGDVLTNITPPDEQTGSSENPTSELVNGTPPRPKAEV